jgi:hypothetical protein
LQVIQGTWHSQFVGRFNALEGLTLTSDQKHLLVCDSGNRCVHLVDVETGLTLKSLNGNGRLVEPLHAELIVSSGHVVVLDQGQSFQPPSPPTLFVLAGLDSDAVVRTIGDGKGSAPRQFCSPVGLAILDVPESPASLADGPVAVVADTYNHRLALWCVQGGSLLGLIGKYGTEPGQFAWPSAVSVVPRQWTQTDEAWLVVADSSNRRVQLLTTAGEVIRVLQGTPEARLGQWLTGLSFNIMTGEIFVMDHLQACVCAWNWHEGCMRIVVSRDLCRPHGIVVWGSANTMFVSDTGSRSILLFQ